MEDHDNVHAGLGGAIREIRRLMNDEKEVKVVREGDTNLLLATGGQKVTATETTNAIDAYTDIVPLKRQGGVTLHRIDDLIAFVARFKGDETVLFTSGTTRAEITRGASAKIKVVFNYHDEGPVEVVRRPIGDDKESVQFEPDIREKGAGRCDFAAIYSFPQSVELGRWRSVSGDSLTPAQLAEFIETNIMDVQVPTYGLISDASEEGSEDWEVGLAEISRRIGGRWAKPADLVAMSREFKVDEISKIEMKRNRDNGTITAVVQEEHTDEAGAPIEIPNLILIAIPMFDGGPLYRLAVRLSYSARSGSVKFKMDIFDLEQAYGAAVDAVVDKVREETGLPVFYGSDA